MTDWISESVTPGGVRALVLMEPLFSVVYDDELSVLLRTSAAKPRLCSKEFPSAVIVVATNLTHLSSTKRNNNNNKEEEQKLFSCTISDGTSSMSNVYLSTCLDDDNKEEETKAGRTYLLRVYGHVTSYANVNATKPFLWITDYAALEVTNDDLNNNDMNIGADLASSGANGREPSSNTDDQLAAPILLLSDTSRWIAPIESFAVEMLAGFTSVTEISNNRRAALPLQDIVDFFEYYRALKCVKEREQRNRSSAHHHQETTSSSSATTTTTTITTHYFDRAIQELENEYVRKLTGGDGNPREVQYRQALDTAWLTEAANSISMSSNSNNNSKKKRSSAKQQPPSPYSCKSLSRFHRILLEGTDEEDDQGRRTTSSNLFRLFRWTEQSSSSSSSCSMQDKMDEYSKGLDALEEHLRNSLCEEVDGSTSSSSSSSPESLETLILSAATLSAATCFSIWSLKPFRKGNFRLLQIIFNWSLHRILGYSNSNTAPPFRFTLSSGGQRGREALTTAVQQIQCNLSLVAVGTASSELLPQALGLTSMFFPLVLLILRRFKCAIHKLDALIKIERDNDTGHSNKNEQQQQSQEEGMQENNNNNTAAAAGKTDDDDVVAKNNSELEERVARAIRQRQMEGDCLICFDEGPNISLLCCGKPIHFHCLHRWLDSAQRSNKTCPQCRKVVPLRAPTISSSSSSAPQQQTRNYHSPSNGNAPAGGYNSWRGARQRGNVISTIYIGDDPIPPFSPRPRPTNTHRGVQFNMDNLEDEGEASTTDSSWSGSWSYDSPPTVSEQQQQQQPGDPTPPDPIALSSSWMIEPPPSLTSSTRESPSTRTRRSESIPSDIPSWTVEEWPTVAAHLNGPMESVSTPPLEIFASVPIDPPLLGPSASRSPSTLPSTPPTAPPHDTTPLWIRRREARLSSDFGGPTTAAATLATTALGGLPTLWEGNHESFDNLDLIFSDEEINELW